MLPFLLSVSAIWAVAAVTPGPNFLVVSRSAVAGGRPAAVAAVAGTVAGTAVWGVAGWLGISALFTAAPLAHAVLKVVGGTYLVWLGLRLLRDAWNGRAITLQAAGGGHGTMAGFRQGLLTNLTNPKSAVFVAGLFAATLPPDAPAVFGLTAVATMVLISGLWYGLLALMLSRPGVGHAYLRVRRRIDALAGMIFIGFGLRLAFVERSG